MQLTDGQVMDFTKKESQPYLDDRWNNSIPTGNTQESLSSTQAIVPGGESKTESCVIVQPAPIWVQPSVTPNTVPLVPPSLRLQPYIGNPILAPSNPFPQGPLYPWPYPGYPSQPVEPFVPQSVGTPDQLSKVFEKVTARKEALESIDQTPETRAVIKALDWVLNTIVGTNITC